MNYSNEQREDHIITDKDSFSIIESYRNLMTNISFCIEKKENERAIRLMVTSAEEQEGKTTVAVNLALTMAQSNKKVLLIDVDLRKARIHRFFKTKNEKGIADYLCGKAEKEEILRKTKWENLDLVYSGFRAPNPNELLSGKRFKEFLEEVSEEYDYILIDTPPVTAVSDALLVGVKTDGAILVTSCKKSSKVLINETIKQLEFAEIKVLGFVLNEYVLKNCINNNYKKNYSYC